MAPKKTHAKAAREAVPERLLPMDLDAERLCLGAILINEANWGKISAIIDEPDLSRESNRRIWSRMRALSEAGEQINRITLSGALQDVGHLESVGGLTGLLELDEGLPEIINPESLARRVKEKSKLRDLIREAQRMMDWAYTGVSPAQDIATRAIEKITPVQAPDEDREDGRRPEEIVGQFPGGIGAFLDPTLRKRGLATGFRKLDEMLGGGFQDGELIIGAARPSVGKSAWMLNICQNVALHDKHPQRCDVFSLEMSGESLITRMMCAVARVDSSKFRAAFLNADERRRLQRGLDWIINAPLRIHDDFKKTLPGLIRRIRHAHKEGSKLIAIDYIQLMVTGSKAENRNLEIGEIGRALKLVALELQIPILLLSQISRAAEKRGGDQRPQLADLKDSGTLEEHADTVITIYREELVKKDREDVRGLADLEILKQRNGPVGRIPLRFLGQYTKFENRAEDFVEDPEEPEMPPPIQHFAAPERDEEPRQREVDW
jgi:replicative DNA helicase